MERAEADKRETAPPVSICIATRNRRDDLLIALASCFAQSYRPLEVLVFDDASTDGTEWTVRERFPGVVYRRADEPRGYVALRNEALRTAGGKYVFTLDDDAYFSDAGTVGQIVRQLEADDGIAAVAIPFLEPPAATPAAYRARQVTPLSPGTAVRSYRGCANAVRREAALAAGGYRDYFVHQGEERDLCLRLLDRGGRVVYGASPPMVHAASPARDTRRIDRYGVRNTLLFDGLNVPFPQVLVRLTADAFALAAYKLSWRTFHRRLWYVAGGLAACLRYAADRHAVARTTYRTYRGLPLTRPEPWPDSGPPPPLPKAPVAAPRVPATARQQLVSVCVVTHNRKHDLLIAVESCLAQTYRPLEILLFDDGSTDGTEEAVRDRWPEVRYFRAQGNEGLAALRNRGFREARGEIVIGMDDDSYFSDPRTVEGLLRDFETHPEAAVIAMPFVEPGRPHIPRMPPLRASDQPQLRTYTGCAHAIRREVALRIGGYTEAFVYRIIDRDVSIRLLARGFHIVYGSTPPMVHLYSMDRDWDRMRTLSIRNSMLFDFLYVPWPHMPLRLAADTIRLFFRRLDPGSWGATIRGVTRGVAACWRHARLRRPMRRDAYRRFRRLQAHGPIAWEGELPAPARPRS